MAQWHATETNGKIYVSQAIIYPFAKDARVFWSGNLTDFPTLEKAVLAAQTKEPWHDWDNSFCLFLNYSCKARNKDKVATRTKPTEPGYYWLLWYYSTETTQEKHWLDSEPVEVRQRDFIGEIKYQVKGFNWENPAYLESMPDDFLWIGPIENPFGDQK